LMKKMHQYCISIYLLTVYAIAKCLNLFL